MPELDDAVVTRSIINRSVSRYEGNAKTIRPYAFAACANLLEVVCPSCSSIGSVAFNGCYALSAISFPECQVIAQYAFQSCDSLVVASFPNCRLLYSYVFNGLSSLREVYLPLLSRCSGTSTTAVNMFAYCPNLEYVDLSSLEILQNNAINFCSALSSLILPVCSIIASNAFWGCPSLSTITLLSSAVCVTTASNWLTQTGITPSRGSIFVPASLVNSYEAASIWSLYSSRIFPYSAS